MATSQDQDELHQTPHRRHSVEELSTTAQRRLSTGDVEKAIDISDASANRLSTSASNTPTQTPDAISPDFFALLAWFSSFPLTTITRSSTRMAIAALICTVPVILFLEHRMFSGFTSLSTFATIANYHPIPYCALLPGTDPCVFDVGFHKGFASKVYLESGYKVLGVETNPELLGRGHSSLTEYSLRDRLRLIGIGIHEQSNQAVPFYINKNDAWSSFDVKWGCRDDSGQPAETISARWCSKIIVRTATCADLFDRFGVPVYLRVSLENKEWACLDSLRALARSRLPDFVSVSNSDVPFLNLLWELGYNKFKVVDMYYEQSKTPEELLKMGTSVSDWGHSVLHMRHDANWRSYYEVADMTRPTVDPKTNETLWYALHAYREV